MLNEFQINAIVNICAANISYQGAITDIELYILLLINFNIPIILDAVGICMEYLLKFYIYTYIYTYIHIYMHTVYPTKQAHVFVSLSFVVVT